MQAIKKPFRLRSNPAREQGAAAIEFALVAVTFFILVFGVIELARLMYVCNTLQEVTRRAAALAANANFSDTAAMQHVREQAVLRTSPGPLMFAEPVTDAHIKIDYMWIKRNGSSMTMEEISSSSLPASPAVNYANCLRDPNSEGCIRLVRVRVCQPEAGGACTRVPYQPLTSLIPLPMTFLPISLTIVNAETLGLPAGVATDTCGCS